MSPYPHTPIPPYFFLLLANVSLPVTFEGLTAETGNPVTAANPIT